MINKYKLYNFKLTKCSKNEYKNLTDKDNSTIYLILNDELICEEIYLGDKLISPIENIISDTISNKINDGIIFSSLNNQNLDGEKKSQIRKNIGAVSVNDIDSFIIKNLDDASKNYNANFSLKSGQLTLNNETIDDTIAD